MPPSYNLRAPVLDYLGRISYGLYMLHGIAIVVALQLVGRVFAATTGAHHAAT